MMELESRKIAFVQEFLRVENEEIVRGLEILLKRKKAELFEKNLKPMSLEEFNQEIDESMEDSRKEDIISSNDLKSKIEKWN
ncbi:hypothetical protein SYJ56_14630 [Algoriphagus sp. D3-2-R+10]|uniref:hypothetical protein n=1 Tax=Algoriphagus aurantiacus TaxID=3103948 RepID=UPI002B3BFDE9|nr:hypothetical protein [Algoriphagus sp. D3-2-R+10]MEB2776556.1 hypothetical protein [Algoriphagus sp. D3-2-R+10]